jgi:ribosome-binding factor A
MNESKRQKTMAKQLQRDLSDIFLQHKDLIGNRFVTIMEIRLSVDLSIARIYVSGMLDKNKTGLLEILDGNKNMIRQELGRRIKNSVRHVPDLRFIVDETELNAEKIADIIDQLDIPPPQDEDKLSENYRF